MAGNAITLDASGATGTQTLTPANGSAVTFNPSAVEATILTFAAPHGLQTGQPLEYQAGSAAIGGVTSGKTYYAIVVGSDQIELASSFANAQAGIAIALDFSQASGTQTFLPLTFSINASTTTIIVSVARASPCRGNKSGRTPATQRSPARSALMTSSTRPRPTSRTPRWPSHARRGSWRCSRRHGRPRRIHRLVDRRRRRRLALERTASPVHRAPPWLGRFRSTSTCLIPKPTVGCKRDPGG